MNAQVVHRIYFDRFTHYDGDDWVSYAPATEINTVTIGDDYVYLGTAQGGVLRYHLYDNFWDYPFTTSTGLSSNQIFSLIFNPDDRRLYARTAAGLNSYDRAFGYWTLADESQITNRRRPPQFELDNMGQQTGFRMPSYYRPRISELPDFFTDSDYLYRPEGEILDEHNRVFQITTAMVDPWYRLWMGTNGLGVAIGNLDNISMKIMQRSIPNIYTRDMVFNGRYAWFGGKSQRTAPSGIARWDLEKDNWTYYEASLNFDIYNDEVFVIDTFHGDVCFGTELGLVVHNPKKDKWRSYTIANGLESNLINDLLPVKNRMYIATDEGLNWLDRAPRKIQESDDVRMDNVPVYQLAVWDSTEILLGTRNGLIRYDVKEDSFSLFETRSALLDLEITALGVHNDSLWIAGQSGIALYDSANGSWQSYTQVLNQVNARINDIDFTKGNVWFATFNGLLKYDVNRDYWYLYTTEDGLIDNRVYRIDVDRDDLWMSTERGISIFRWYEPDRIE